jgi:hypothetical protein
MCTLAVAGVLADTIDRIDLCEPCGRALVEWLRSQEPEATLPNPGPLQEIPR